MWPFFLHLFNAVVCLICVTYSLIFLSCFGIFPLANLIKSFKKLALDFWGPCQQYSVVRRDWGIWWQEEDNGWIIPFVSGHQSGPVIRSTALDLLTSIIQLSYTSGSGNTGIEDFNVPRAHFTNSFFLLQFRLDEKFILLSTQFW